MNHNHDGKFMKQCPYCDKKLAKKQNLELHIDRRHSDTGEKSFICDHCGKGFIYQSTLLNHQQQKLCSKPQNNRKLIKCDYCVKVFDLRKEIKPHYEQYHPDQSIILEGTKRYYCQNCQEVYFDRKALRIHRKTHEEITTKTGENRSSTKTRKFECKVCQETFITASGRRDHMFEKHTTEYEHLVENKCITCGVKCPTTKALNRHIKRYHTLEKHRCEPCQKTFISKQLYEDHVRQSHARVQCDVCHKDFCNKFLLKKHRIFAHGIEEEGALFCPICPRSKVVFFRKQKLKIHMQSKHDMVL